MKREWLMAVLCSLLVACATTRPVSPAAGCEQGDAWACDTWGRQLREQGAREEAEAAYGRACEEGLTSGCLAQGQLRLEEGDLAGAEPPLVKAYEAGNESGALALADLREARGEAATAERLRREAVALNKPDFEFVFGYRAGLVGGGSGPEVSLNIQPMAFYERRLSFGAHTAFDVRLGLSELNGFIAYQHFESSWLVPYARLLAGSASGLNLGGEVGAKLCFEDIGHLNVAAGASWASGGYVSVGLGLDGIIVLLMALHAL